MGNYPSFISSVILSLALPLVADAAEPSWAKQGTMQRQGDILNLVCYSSAPSLDLARHSALESCRKTAADNKNSNIEIKTMSIETEKSVAYHSEATSQLSVKNLECEILKEESNDAGGTFTDYIQCRFDLGKAVLTPITGVTVSTPKNATSAIGLIDQQQDLEKVPSYPGAPSNAQDVQSENRILIFSFIPQCDDILIRGDRPRSVPCTGNPKSLLIFPTDSELIVRATGYLPQHVHLNGSRAPASAHRAERLELILERN